jgi:hypothetical protein
MRNAHTSEKPFVREVISTYSQKQAIEDGALVEVFKNRWAELSGGKPIIATRAVFNAFSLAALLEIWNDFVVWKKKIEPNLPEEEKMFVTKAMGDKVWLIEDEVAFTIMYPRDY